MTFKQLLLAWSERCGLSNNRFKVRATTIGCLCSYSIADKRLDQILSDGNLGKIADSMSEWKGPIAEQLELTVADIEAIQVEEPRKHKLQT